MKTVEILRGTFVEGRTVSPGEVVAVSDESAAVLISIGKARPAKAAPVAVREIASAVPVVEAAASIPLVQPRKARK